MAMTMMVMVRRVRRTVQCGAGGAEMGLAPA
jgi:hypothetical protein